MLQMINNNNNDNLGIVSGGCHHLSESDAEVIHQFSLQDQELELGSRTGQNPVPLCVQQERNTIIIHPLTY